MNKTTKDITQENDPHMAVVKNQKKKRTELVTSNALVVYDEQEARSQKKGLIGNLRRRANPSRDQLGKLLLDNIQAFPEHEARLLRSVFDLKTLTAQEVMMPLSEITLLTIQSSPADVPKFCSEFNYRYIPIYNQRVDQLLGVVDAMEVFTTDQDNDDLSPFVKELSYVPPLKSAMDLLGELRQSEVPAAIVVNEHGSCIGIVELIDILEKIVGNIEANRKRNTPRLEQLGNNQWTIDARALIVDVNIALNTEIPTDWCDTIGGFILVLLGRLPQKGEKIEYENYHFIIEDIFKYGISRLQAMKKPQKTKR
jgi:CBS domain containing-hemolysin-like protein